jgi:hypothetical protein
MDIERTLRNVPWVTKDGIDLGRFPIDGVLKQALVIPVRSVLTLALGSPSHSRFKPHSVSCESAIRRSINVSSEVK